MDLGAPDGGLALGLIPSALCRSLKLLCPLNFARPDTYSVTQKREGKTLPLNFAPLAGTQLL